MRFINKYFGRKKSINISKRPVHLMDKIISSLDEDIKNLEDAIKLASKESNTTNLPIVINSFLFFRVTFKDIVLVTEQLIEEKDEQKKNLLIRTVALHLYEFLDDTKDFLGQRLRVSLKQFPDSDFHMQELNKLKKYYSIIKNLIFKELGDIRHSVIAHKDQNSIELNRKIKELNQPNNIHGFCMLVWVLYGLILRFQKNLLISLKVDYYSKNESQNSLEKTFEKSKNVAEFISVDIEFNKCLMLFSGISFPGLKFLDDLTPDVLAKLKGFAKNYEKGNSISEFLNKLTPDELVKFYEAIKKYEKRERDFPEL